jgi:hypothetical protein
MVFERTGCDLEVVGQLPVGQAGSGQGEVHYSPSSPFTHRSHSRFVHHRSLPLSPYRCARHDRQMVCVCEDTADTSNECRRGDVQMGQVTRHPR